CVGALVPAGDHAALAERIHALWADPARRARMAEDGTVLAAERTWPELVRRYDAVYGQAGSGVEEEQRVESDVKQPPEVVSALESHGMDALGLSPIGVRPPLDQYLRELWGRRHFIWMDSRHRLATKNARNRLGRVWLVLRPTFDALLYFVIFVLIIGARGGIENFAAYVVVGILMFQSTMRSVSQGPGLIRSG